MESIAVVSAFIPVEGLWEIKKITLQKALEMLYIFPHGIYTQHQTIKILHLEPATERKVYNPTTDEVQLWIKPKERLEFGREYTIDEIKEIGYDIYIAFPRKEDK